MVKRSIFLATTFLMLFSGHVFSQNMRFGIFIDPQMSWLKADTRNITGKGSRPGVNIGMNYEGYFAPNYAFYSGISINSLGGKLQYADTTDFEIQGRTQRIPAGSVVTYKLQYVSIPLGLKFKSNEIGYTTFFAQMGFNTQLNVRANADFSNLILKDENISKEVNLFALGYFFGGGFEYSLGGTTAISMGMIYYSNFTDVITSDDHKAILRNVSIRLGLMF